MRSVKFVAYGHENVIGEHKTTVELTTENFLSRQGTCIIGVRADQRLSDLSEDIKIIVKSENTQIVLRMKADDKIEEIVGYGSPGLTYEDSISMVARTSSFECGRTLMVNADKAASDLSRSFIEKLGISNNRIECELIFLTE
jgi:uncharacterized protein